MARQLVTSASPAYPRGSQVAPGSNPGVPAYRLSSKADMVGSRSVSRDTEPRFGFVVCVCGGGGGGGGAETPNHDSFRSYFVAECMHACERACKRACVRM